MEVLWPGIVTVLTAAKDLEDDHIELVMFILLLLINYCFQTEKIIDNKIKEPNVYSDGLIFPRKMRNIFVTSV